MHVLAIITIVNVKYEKVKINESKIHFSWWPIPKAPIYTDCIIRADGVTRSNSGAEEVLEFHGELLNYNYYYILLSCQHTNLIHTSTCINAE